MKTLILTEEQMHHSRACEVVFDYFCMLVDRHTDPLDMNRHTIVAIHQAQNYAELIEDFELLTQCQLMEKSWFKGEL
jgi:hypothetical protein